MKIALHRYLVQANNWLQSLESILLSTILVIYFIISLSTSWLLVQQFQLGKMDTALYQTSLWQAGQFRNPLAYITYALAGIPTHPFIGLHFMPIGFVYGLIYRFFSGLYTTAVLYSIFFTLAGFFVYRSVRVLTKNIGIALIFTIVYLYAFTSIAPFYPIEDWSAVYAAAALYFFVCRRYGWASIAFLLLMMSKEYYSLTIAAFGGIIWVTDTYVSIRNMRNLNLSCKPLQIRTFPYLIGLWAANKKFGGSCG